MINRRDFMKESDFNKAGVVGILLMSGTGERFGSSSPKQFHRLSGKKIYLHTLERFLEADLFEELLLVCHSAWIDDVLQDLQEYPHAPIRIVVGGKTRQESSFLGLMACKEGTRIVVIHDAVRPFVSTQILLDNVRAAQEHGAVDTCIPSADTIVYSKIGQVIDGIPTRSEYQRGQTPQSFSYPLILQAHQEARANGVENASDDCTLLIKMQKPVHITPGDECNIKITTELDLFLAEQLSFKRKKQLFSSSCKNSCLKGKCYAITGGTGGIGQALAVLLENEGAQVLKIARGSLKYPADLRSFDIAQATFDTIYKTHGPLDGLINSIGLFKRKKVEELAPDEIEELIAANLTSLIFSCKCAQIKPKGHILNIASSAYSRGRKEYAVYACAKAAVVNFTQGLAEERPDLLINTLVPQRTLTSMRQKHFPDENPATLLKPEEVAQAIIDLLKNTQTTGTILDVRKDKMP